MIPIVRPELPPLADYVRLLERVWGSRMLSNFGPFATELERLASDYLGVGVRAVASGDLGLMCAIAALNVKPGSTCVVPSFTFNSTINAVLWNDLVPVFADVDPHTFNVDPASVAHAARESGARLIVATHVFGNPADAAALGRTAAEYGARLLFDAAHGYGSLRDGVHVGALGDDEVFSLSGTKPVTCGEGGLVASRDPQLLERVVYHRGYGFQGDYESRCIGVNAKMSELHAALGSMTLPTIERALAHRQTQLARYRANLAGIAGLAYQQVRASDRSTFKDFAVVFPDGAARAAVETALKERAVQTKRYFRPCHKMAAYRPFAFEPLPHTDALYERILCLPLFHDLADAQIDMVCDVVRQTVAAAVAR